MEAIARERERLRGGGGRLSGGNGAGAITDPEPTQLDEPIPGWGPLPIPNGHDTAGARGGRNTLLTAAQEVLLFGMELDRHARRVSLPDLRRQAVQHIQLFERRARSLGVARQQLMWARYGLCTFLDELVAILPKGPGESVRPENWVLDDPYPAGASGISARESTLWQEEDGWGPNAWPTPATAHQADERRRGPLPGPWHEDEGLREEWRRDTGCQDDMSQRESDPEGWTQEAWSQESLLSRFHGETYGGQDFFLILRRVCAEPAQNLDLLELWFVILSLGFEGKYRLDPEGPRKLDQLRELLLALIRSYRGDFQTGLQVGASHSSARTPVRRTVSWRMLAAGGLLCLGLVQGLFHVVLDREYQQLRQELDVLAASVRSGPGGT